MTLAALLSAYAALNVAIAAAVTGLVAVELFASRLSSRVLRPS